MVLVRHEIGDVLRDLRLQQGKTLRQVASRASVALGYLSEVERGQKEASSEVLASVAVALETPISSIMREVGDRFAVIEGSGMYAPAVESIPALDADVLDARAMEASALEAIPVVEEAVIPDTLPDELLAEFGFDGDAAFAAR